ncbi:MAG: condensation domain-containing protein [Pyrinomonadaceae bacterium]
MKEQMRGAPGGGLVYGLLRYLGRAAVIEKLRHLPQSQISFNYLGQFDQIFSDTSIFATTGENVGSEHALEERRRHLLEVIAVISEGCLRIRLTYSENIHSDATIETLARNYLSALRSIVDHCASPEAGGYTPSDFPLAKLDQRSLDELAKDHPHIEDIYPLSPMQQEMLLHTLSMPESELGFVQNCWTLGADFDPSAFKQAWQKAIDRHPVLRTSVYWEGLTEALQIVHPRVTLNWEEHDWSEFSGSEQERRLEELLSEDRRRGFDLSKAPLMRLILVRCSSGESRFILSCHHLALDGWSLPLVLNEVLTFYNSSRYGEEFYLERSRPYRDYIVWLKQQDSTKAESFWRGMFTGLTSPAPLLADFTPVHQSNGNRYGESETSLSEETTATLASLARKHQLTPSTIVQGAWALLLSRYTGSRDVVFGMTVSGRSPELADVENMVGLFINVLPVRIAVPSEAKLTDWLKDIQARQVEFRQYEHIPRSQVQAWSEVPLSRPLFETVVVYENYPIDEAALLEKIGSLELELHHHFGTRASTPITLVVIPGPKLHMRIAYDNRRFDADTIEGMLRRLKTLLGVFASGAGRSLSEYSLLTESERQSLMQWGITQRESVLDQLNGEREEALALGDPLTAGSVYILGGDLEMTPVGVPGQLYISGRTAARADEKAIPDPFSQEPDAYLYKVGRAGRYLSDGRIEMLGRNGARVKVRGYDVKLEEIETVLKRHSAVSDVAVIARENQLVAYLVSSRQSDMLLQQLRAFLKQELPDHMQPSDLVMLPSLPRTPDAKVDYSALPEPNFAHSLSKVILLGDIAPHDFLEYQLARVWEHVFDIRPISPTDNFFDLGGTSIMALSLISEIHNKLSLDLPLSVLFKGATIREMAQTLRERTGSFSWSPLVPIRSGGSKRPFFCVHAAGGNVLGFIDLAQHIDPDRPFYGLQSVGLDGKDEPYSRVEEMAARYIEEIRSVQPDGPYLLGGLSFGGLVAFEMARQFEARGEEVSLLALLDSWSPIFEGRLFFSELLPHDNLELLSYLSQEVRELCEKTPSLKEMELNQQIDFVLEQIGGPDSFGGISEEYVRRVTKIHLNSTRAVRDYVPQPYQGRITILRAIETGPQSHYVISHPALGRPEIMSGWRELTSEPLQIFDVPGDHMTMMTEPHVRVIAERLNSCLDGSHTG